jgi:hypothetical protein
MKTFQNDVHFMYIGVCVSEQIIDIEIVPP